MNQPEMPTTLTKPTILVNWRSKLLVGVLCAMSFWAGWQAQRSHHIKACQQANGIMTTVNGVALCQQ